MGPEVRGDNVMKKMNRYISNSQMMSMAFILYSVSYPYIHSKKHLIFAVRRSLQKCISDFSIYMEIDCSKSRWSRRRRKDNSVSDRRLFLHSFIRLWWKWLKINVGFHSICISSLCVVTSQLRADCSNVVMVWQSCQLAACHQMECISSLQPSICWNTLVFVFVCVSVCCVDKRRWVQIITPSIIQ